MFSNAVIVARKEIRDHLRDTRSLIASAFYALMGPLVVGMVSLAVRGEKSSDVLAGMLSVFALVAVFVGGMNVAIDSIAGERERRSLLPLLMNPLPRRDVVVGKWLSIAVFAAAGVVLNLAGFGILLKSPPQALAALALTLIPLTAFAAALELVISTWSTNVKEAHTYLSLAIFLPMGAGMFLVFFPHMASTLLFIPVAGQQFVMDTIAKSGQLPLLALFTVTLTTAASAAALLAIAAKLLERDDVVYGG
jgi:sodium transport system permease protein